MNAAEGSVDEQGSKRTLSLMIVFLFLLIIPAGLLLPQWIGLGWTWGAVAIIMFVAIGATGLNLGKGWSGVLIDPQTNTMSLSRTQIILWTWVILSAFVTLALARVSDSRTHPEGYVSGSQVFGSDVNRSEPLGIQIPPLLWALMGISLTSAVGSPLLKAAKAQKTVAQDGASQQRAIKRGLSNAAAETYRAVLDDRKRGDEKLSEQVGEAKPLGALLRKDSWRKAQFSDVLTGEEVATFGYVDIAKVQNLLFTVIAIVAYTVTLEAAMAGTQNIATLIALPDLPPGLVAIIGISHGGYLIDKAVTHSTPTEGTPPEV